jgi:sulfane dehydrogenase subunit SoxC
MVDRPLILTMDEIKRLPSVTRTYFIECSGNSRSEWSATGAPTAQLASGLASCSEWTGVPLRLLLEETGVQAGAAWILAEGDDACHMQRSLPLDKALDDCLLAYGQNGEAIRPEQGYPLRLIAPGYEGNVCVKWLRRIKVADTAYMTRDETSKYTDLLAGGKARIFSYVMEAKSVITRPSGGQRLPGPGKYEISGLAWSGAGEIRGVEISTDGGQTWRPAEIEGPIHSKAFTRFRTMWEWDGSPAVIASRAIDKTGYVQPPRETLIAARGMNPDYHNNAIKPWTIAADGSVTNA